ncbi:MAG: DUF1697 domain-containing protein [Acidobacteria bacterium]|nr:DUF1697 domain-containing protein [Acidobacteriota bacterium]
MPRYIAFLRAINVGGHNVKMAELRTLFEALNFEKVETFIASGNVIFETGATDTAAMERQIEDHLHQALGYAVATFLRTDQEVSAIARYRPFSEEELAAAQALNIAFLAATLAQEAIESVLRFQTEIDTFHVNGREVYWLCRTKQSESTFSNVVFERVLKTKATFRGRNTVLKLAAKYPPE